MEPRSFRPSFHQGQPARPYDPQPVATYSHELAPDSLQAAGPQTQNSGAPGSTKPVPVVRVLSPVGVEYVFLILTLFIGAIALIAVLISLVNGKADFSVLAFPAAVLTVTVPVFAVIFLHLKRLETRLPGLRLDASKRRSTQFAQIFAFGACLATLIGFVFDVFSKLGGQGGPSIMKAALDALCVLVVAGGMLAYYWHDEHNLHR